MLGTSCASPPAEFTVVHTRLLQLALAIEDSRAYWANVDPTMARARAALAAFEQRWFGAKSLGRVKKLIANFVLRYDSFPAALTVLRQWPAMDPATRQAICHWHLQLVDPMYRRFTTEFLGQRCDADDPDLDRGRVSRWLRSTYGDRWAGSTINQFASKLLSAATQAGLVSRYPGSRRRLLPKLTDQALGYLLYLLRATTFAGNLVGNPYMESVGLSGALLEARLQRLPGITYRRLVDVDDFGWHYPSLTAWAEASL